MEVRWGGGFDGWGVVFEGIFFGGGFWFKGGGVIVGGKRKRVVWKKGVVLVGDLFWGSLAWGWGRVFLWGVGWRDGLGGGGGGYSLGR